MTSQQQSNKGKQAIILAGGMGTRLKPYTTTFPKALVPLGDMPVLELVLRQLKHHGFTNITLAVGHLAQLIQAYFGTGEKLGLSITYSHEDKPMGTAGPIKMLEDTLHDNFLVMNADIVSDIDYGNVFDTHINDTFNPLATVAVHRRTSKIDFGIIDYDSNNAIQNFTEKPVYEHSVSMGIYMFNKAICEHIPEDTFYGFDQLMKHLIQQQLPLKAHPFNGYWLDIGRVDDYEMAVNDFQNKREQLLPSSTTAPISSDANAAIT